MKTGVRGTDDKLEYLGWFSQQNWLDGTAREQILDCKSAGFRL